MAYLDPVWNNIYEEYVHNVVTLVELLITALITRYDRTPSSTPVLKYRVQKAPTLEYFPVQRLLEKSLRIGQPPECIRCACI